MGILDNFFGADIGERLVEAVERRDASAVAKILKKNFDRSEYHDDMSRALLSAVHFGDFEIIKALIAGGADIESRATNDFHNLIVGATPLMVAANNGETEILRFLLEHGANPNARADKGTTPLDAACNAKHKDIVAELLQKGAAPNGGGGDKDISPLMVAAHYGQFEIAKSLIDYGADVDFSKQSDHYSVPVGMTALMEAASAGRFPIVKLLVENGADVNLKNVQKKSALYYAGRVSSLKEIEEYLLEHGANKEDGYTLRIEDLLDACKYGNIDTFHKCIEVGVDINGQADDTIHHKTGITPLMVALVERNLDIIEEILKIDGLDVNVKGPDGETALFLAINYFKYDIARQLVELGADTGVINDYNNSVLGLACRSGETDLVQLMFDNGATVASLTKQDNIQIIELNSWGYKGIAKMLTDRGYY